MIFMIVPTLVDAPRRIPLKISGYIASVLGVAAMTGLIAVVPSAEHTANVSLVYLLVVMGAAFWLGRSPAVGFALGCLVLRRAALRGEIHNLNERVLNRLVMALIAGVVLGGRLGFVVQNIGAWRADPLFPLKVWSGGMAFFGGLLGVILAVVWAVRRYKLRFWQVADALTFPSALGLALASGASPTS